MQQALPTNQSRYILVIGVNISGGAGGQLPLLPLRRQGGPSRFSCGVERIIIPLSLPGRGRRFLLSSLHMGRGVAGHRAMGAELWRCFPKLSFRALDCLKPALFPRPSPGPKELGMLSSGEPVMREVAAGFVPPDS